MVRHNNWKLITLQLVDKAGEEEVVLKRKFGDETYVQLDWLTIIK